MNSLTTSETSRHSGDKVGENLRLGEANCIREAIRGTSSKQSKLTISINTLLTASQCSVVSVLEVGT